MSKVAVVYQWLDFEEVAYLGLMVTQMTIFPDSKLLVGIKKMF